MKRINNLKLINTYINIDDLDEKDIENLDVLIDKHLGS